MKNLIVVNLPFANGSGIVVSERKNFQRVSDILWNLWFDSVGSPVGVFSSGVSLRNARLWFFLSVFKPAMFKTYDGFVSFVSYPDDPPENEKIWRFVSKNSMDVISVLLAVNGDPSEMIKHIAWSCNITPKEFSLNSLEKVGHFNGASFDFGLSTVKLISLA